MVNSRLGLFAAAPERSCGKRNHAPGHPFSRSYGVNLPSSLTWFLSRTLGFSPYLPVSVYGTDPRPSTLRSFSRRQSIGRSALSEDAASRHVSGLTPGGFAARTPYTLGLPLPTGSQPSLLRLSIAQTGKYRNINLLSIGYAFRPRLRVRLTLGGRTWPRKPRIFGGEDSHLSFRYSCLHDHLYAVHPALRQNFALHTTLSYPFRLRGKPRHRFRT